jgi:glycosyltransferase involved in cell wall biosynthesis
MNVLVVNASADLYGANRILLQSMLLLKPRKIILVLPAEGLLTDFIRTNGEYNHVEIKIVKTMPVVFRSMNIKHGFQLLKNIYGFRKAIKKIKKEYFVNWAYVNTLSAFIIIGILKNLRLKILVHVHEILENDRVFTRLINRYSVKWADKIIAVSNPVALNLKDVSNKENIVTILNGISDMKMPRVTKNNLVTITLFGRIKPEKGIWFFLDAIKLLHENIRNKAKFNIIGSAAPGGDHYLSKLENDIEEHPAKKNIHFKSFIPDIKPTLNSTDVIVVPSLMRDPFPTTILEAASAGKPVIATNTGGAIQSVEDNVTGFLIFPSDTKKFAEYLQALINSEILRNRMGSAARKFYLNNFTLEIFNHNFLRTVKDFEV